MPESSASEPPLVSIVVIFFNAERFLGEAIESVLAQRYRPIEVLLVDDGSADNSRAIAEQYATQRESVRVLQHDGGANLGMSASRNLGLKHCRGRFVGFLDADDIWLPEKLEREVAILRRHPAAAMVCSPTLLWLSWTSQQEEIEAVAGLRSETSNAPNDVLRPIAGGKFDGMVKPPRLLRRHLNWRDALPKTTGALVRRWPALRVGGFEDPFRSAYEDQVFFSKLALKFPAYVSKESLARYRQHADSACNQARFARERNVSPGERSPAHRNYLLWLDGYLRENHPRLGRLRESVRSQLEAEGEPSADDRVE